MSELKSFKHLDFHDDIELDGVQAIEFFPNGYGVSVVCHKYSYGGKSGRYEIAVLVGTKENSSLCYSTPVTDNVIGYCNGEKY